MKVEKLTSLLKKEGEKICPSSFAAISEKVKETDKYFELKLRKEGDNLVQNQYGDIKKNLAGHSNVDIIVPKKSHKLVWGVASSLVAVSAAVIIPVSVISNSNKNSTSIATQAEYTAVKLTINGVDRFTSTNDIDIDYSLDNKGYTIPNTYFGWEGNTNMLLAISDVNQTKRNDTFTEELAKKAKESSIIEKAKISVKAYLYDYKDSGYTASVMNSLTNTFATLNPDEYTIEVVQLNERETRELKISNLKTLYRSLFCYNEDETAPLECHSLFGEVTYSLVPGDDFYNTVDDEYLDKIINKLRSVYFSLQVKENINKFQTDLVKMYDIYQERKTTLINVLKKVQLFDSSLDVDSIVSSLPTSEWWNNAFISESFDNSLFQFNAWDKDLNGYENALHESQGANLFPQDYSEEEIVSKVENLLYENEKWHSFALDIIPYRSRVYNKDNEQYWVSDADKQYWNSDENYWNCYWQDQYNSTHH